MANIRNLTVFLIFLLSVFMLAELPSNVFATTETRINHITKSTVNGLYAYDCWTNVSTATKNSIYYNPTTSIQYGIRVWKRTSGSVETEITSGSPVATVTRNSGSGLLLQSNTWSCPQTSLATTDSIVIRWYENVDSVGWFIILESGYDQWNTTTERLGNTQLDSATWTVYYYNLWSWNSGQGIYYARLELASTATTKTRIEGFSHSTPSGTAYTSDLSKTLTTSWTIDTKTTYQIDFSQAFAMSWLIDVLWTQAAQQYFADLSQSLATTWEILTQSTFQTDFTQTLSTTWEVLTKTDYGISLDLSSATSWIVDLYQGIGYTVDLSLSITTSWIVDVVLNMAEVGFPVLLPFLIIAAMVLVCVSIYVRKQQRQNK